jgi:cell cycle sensor histidine kinase DivJ
MLDMTRIDAGIYDFQPEERDVSTLVEGVVEAFRQEPEARRETFTVRRSGAPVLARIDARAFRGALVQLLSNAVKFGAGKGVEVAVAQDGEDVTVSVTDRGAGMSGDQIALLGRHFSRLDEGLGRESGGIGLGLALAHGIMQLHGGRVSIRSRHGKGATATLHLSASADAAASNVTALDAKRRQAAQPGSSQKERKRA